MHPLVFSWRTWARLGLMGALALAAVLAAAFAGSFPIWFRVFAAVLAAVLIWEAVDLLVFVRRWRFDGDVLHVPCIGRSAREFDPDSGVRYALVDMSKRASLIVVTLADGTRLNVGINVLSSTTDVREWFGDRGESSI